MSSFSQVYDIKNLRRAYRWVLSHPDARYKSYFRDDYAAYALASELNLKILRRRIRDGNYQPSNACKVYLPKASGILRPLSLLTVNDQIAYQASINIVAEELHRRVEKRYGKTVFYHQYAGKSSKFFYRKWEDSYSAYANAIRTQFRAGLQYVASFDLTAFYDSIDHQVLRFFLQQSRIDPETIEFLLNNLKHWSDATWAGGAKNPIYQGHGIPQGPGASGMLSEVVLQHLDRIGDRHSKGVQYLRYVDDIKILARDEKTLRRRLVALDIAAKEIGLFPQGAKIGIRKMQSPEEEIKSISIPPEPADIPFANQDLIRRRVRKLANRGAPSNTTRLKYVLPKLNPTNVTNTILLKVFFNRPDLSDTITRHLEKYTKLPRSVSAWLIAEVLAEGVYHAQNADLLNLLYGRVRPAEIPIVADFCYERLFSPRFRRAAFPAPQPTYRAALIRWALLSTRMNYYDVEGLFKNDRDWWSLQKAILNLDESKFGRPSFEALLNLGAQSRNPDAARVAASLIFRGSLAVHAPHSACHWSARLLLRNVGLIPYAGRAPSLIPDVIAYTVKFSTSYDWIGLFGGSHAQAERLAILSKQRYETDIDAFVVSLDSFCDLVMRQIYLRRGHVMTAAYGNVLTSGAPGWLKTDFPILTNGFLKLHQLRIRSFTAHPKHKTGIPNKRIKHGQFFKIRKTLVDAFSELSRMLP